MNVKYNWPYPPIKLSILIKVHLHRIKPHIIKMGILETFSPANKWNEIKNNPISNRIRDEQFESWLELDPVKLSQLIT